MEESEDKISIDVNAEKIAFNQMIEEQPPAVEPSSKIDSIFYQNNNINASIESIPLQIDIEEKTNIEEDFKNSIDKTNLKVEASIHGIDQTISSTTSDDLMDNLSSVNSRVDTLTEELYKSYHKINQFAAKASPADKFEERVTVLPTNLIYTDRLERTSQHPLWK
jgi:hypothetical protein